MGLKYISDTDIPPNAQIIDTIRTPKKRSRHFLKDTSHYQRDNEEPEPGAAPERLPQPGTPPPEEQQPGVSPEDGNPSPLKGRQMFYQGGGRERKPNMSFLTFDVWT